MLNDQTVRRIARNADNKQLDIGYELGLESAAIEEVQRKYSDPVDQAFYILLVRQQPVILLT